MDAINGQINEEWDILTSFLPENWESKAVELGALTRKRNIQTASVLLRVLLVHLADGKSLRTASAWAKESGLCDINDTSLLRRLTSSGKWLRWLTVELFNRLEMLPSEKRMKPNFRIRLVDGSVVSEQGSKGTDWKLHYCLQWPSIVCDSFRITDYRTGEGLSNFEVKSGDLLVGDRAYCTKKGVSYVKKKGGDALVRFHSTNFPLVGRNGAPFVVLPSLRKLKNGEEGDLDVWFRTKDEILIKGRLCAIRKSAEAMEREKKRLRRIASRQCRNLRPETLEFAEYVVLFTTSNRKKMSKEQVFWVYRGRWQIELVFKRLKGILGFGYLPKFEEGSCISWLYGKMLVALLIENIYREVDFSPWGYPEMHPAQ